MLRKKQNTGGSFDLTSLTLEEPASPVEDVVTINSSAKVGLINLLFCFLSALCILLVMFFYLLFF